MTNRGVEFLKYSKKLLTRLVQTLLYLSVITCTVIDQYSGPLKFKVGFIAKLFCDFSPSESLKLNSFTLNCLLKRANDLKTISN